MLKTIKKLKNNEGTGITEWGGFVAASVSAVILANEAFNWGLSETHLTVLVTFLVGTIPPTIMRVVHKWRCKK